jgi:hypothetical protein
MNRKYTKESLEPVVLKCKGIAEVLRCLGLKQCGGNSSHISKLIKTWKIDSSHFLGKGWNVGGTSTVKRTKESFIEKVLVIDGLKWQSHKIKLKLFEFDLKERKCEKCGQDEMWFGEKLSLHLDHINGNHNDNRLENLKILCPNCHSQTSTFGIKNYKTAPLT